MTKYIIISGVDGSGKTTVINSLKDKLEQQGKTVDYIWMRYNHYTVKAMNAFARILGMCGNTDFIKCHGSVNFMCGVLIWIIRLHKRK